MTSLLKQLYNGVFYSRASDFQSESVACGVEVVLALLRAKEIADFADGAPDGVDGPDGAGRRPSTLRKPSRSD